MIKKLIEIVRSRKQKSIERGLLIKFIDLERLYREDLKNHTGFKIDYTINYEDEPETLLMRNSIFSKEYGITLSDPSHIKDMVYTCKCGHLVGSDNYGITCLECETEVQFNHVSNEQRGWLVIPDNKKILSPIGVNLLISVVGEHAYISLINKKSEITLLNLYENFEKFIEEHKRTQTSKITKKVFEMLGFENSNTDNIKLADILVAEKDKLFTNKIPVISKRMRGHLTEKNFNVLTIKTNSLNSIYICICNILKNMENYDELNPMSTISWRLERMRELYILMEKLYDNLSITLGGGGLNDSILTKKKEKMFDKKKDKYGNEKKRSKPIPSKKKILRNNIYGQRLPYTARQVLTTAHDIAEIDKIQISYDVFRGIIKPEIAEELEKLGYPQEHIRQILDLDRLLTLDEKALLQEICKTINPSIIINRQPTIYEPSSLAVMVDKLIDQNILRVHPTILTLLAGDIDGDVLTLFGIPRELYEDVKIMSPRTYVLDYTMNISGNVELVNDHQVILSSLLDEVASLVED